jgi:hypothetical protein
MVKLIYSDSNFRFNMNVVFITNYSFNKRRSPINNEMILMTDFINLKIKSTQFFKDAHKDIIYMCIFIKINTHIYI